jgi:penicillin-binding protein 2
MINGPDQRTPPMTPQLALRVAVVGGFALVMFALIFFRLWFLQVLDSSHYESLAETNVVRDIPVAAPRGEIEDSSGNVLVGSEPAPAVLISPEALPVPVSLNVAHPGALARQPAKDYELYDKLARLLGMSTKPRNCTYDVYLTSGLHVYRPKLAPIPCLVAQGVASSQYANVTIKSDVPTDIHYYIAERQADFPGVLAQDVYVRTYPLGSDGAQVFGTIGQISQKQIIAAAHGSSALKGIKSGTVIGQSGLESQYNQYLQGTDGEEAVKVNSASQFEGYANGTQPVQGDTLKLSLNTKLEEVGQRALQHSIQLNGGSGGAFIAMDPQNGSIYAMGSAPSFNPSIFTHPLSPAAAANLFSNASNDPLLNRATQGIGPDGSTFKVITAIAALESGKWSPDQTYYDNGCFKADLTAPCQHNAGGNSYGAVNIVTAIQDSVDTFFYNLGAALNFNPLTHPNGGPLQDWARNFGIGERTGVDLPGEQTGSVPDPAYFQYLWQQELDCERAVGPYKGHPKHPASQGGCGIANNPDWTVGDNVNAAVGQGDVQVTPLQLAVAYAAIANGGTIVTPHLGQAIESTTGQVIENIDPAPKRKLTINPTYLNLVRTGLRDAVTSGTSADVMGNFPEQVYGKTGTAQYGSAQQIKSNTEADYAWYAAYVPASATSKPIVVVVWVEKGGFGDIAAAPVARELLSQWFFGNPGPYTAGTGKDL